jgi:hypothetical protein
MMRRPLRWPLSTARNMAGEPLLSTKRVRAKSVAAAAVVVAVAAASAAAAVVEAAGVVASVAAAAVAVAAAVGVAAVATAAAVVVVAEVAADAIATNRLLQHAAKAPAKAGVLFFLRESLVRHRDLQQHRLHWLQRDLLQRDALTVEKIDRFITTVSHRQLERLRLL